MTSIIQGEPINGELIDDRILNGLEPSDGSNLAVSTKNGDCVVLQINHEDNDAGGGSVAASYSPLSIRQTGKSKHVNHVNEKHEESLIVTKGDEDDEDDQMLFAKNLNK